MIRSIKFPARIYVGSAANFATRWEHHKTDLRKNQHDNLKLQRHCNKYGISDLEFSVIEDGIYIDRIHILAREQMWFDRFSFDGTGLPYFNMTPIAGCNIGVKYSEESKRRISEAHKGKIVSEETRMKLRNYNLGRKTTKEQRKRQSIAQQKAIYQFDLNGVFIKEWDSLKKAAECLGIKRNCISSAVNGVYRRYGGYVWRFKKDIGEIRNLTNKETKFAFKHALAKPIIQMDKMGVIIRDWCSIKEAARHLNVSDTNIGRCCKGGRGTAYGFKWKYKE